MSIIINILLIILYFINTINTIYFLQQDNYHYRCFKVLLINDLKYKGYIYIILVVTLIINILIKSLISTIVIILLILLLIMYLLKQTKIFKLKYTNRIKRLFFLHIIFIFPFILFNYLLFVINTLYLLINILITSLSILIENILIKKYYQKAYNKVKEYKPFIIGITGSAGKTSVKNYIYDCLKQYYITYKSPKSYNTLKGLTLTINKYLHSFNNYFILEMGLSHKGDIKKITKYYHPNISIITEILPSHLQTMKTIEAIIEEKMQIIYNMQPNGLIIINGDNELIVNNVNKYNINNNKIIKVGFSNINDIYVSDYKLNKDSTFLVIHYNNNDYPINTSLIGRHNIYNILIVFCLLISLNYDVDDIIRLLSSLQNYENRLELKHYKQLTILNDSYNSNINGFINALEILSLYEGKKYIITPGIVEGGTESNEMIKKIVEKIVLTCDYCYLIKNKNIPYFIHYFTMYNYSNYKIKNNFFDAFEEIKNEQLTVLIENDLTDFYYIQ